MDTAEIRELISAFVTEEILLDGTAEVSHCLLNSIQSPLSFPSLQTASRSYYVRQTLSLANIVYLGIKY